MLTRRFVLTGMIAAPVVIAADRLMPVRSIVQRYATVYGVGWDFEVVEHVAWNVEDALKFANFRGGGIDKFREITDVVYEVSMPPLPTPAPMSNWSKAADPVSSAIGSSYFWLKLWGTGSPLFHRSLKLENGEAICVQISTGLGVTNGCRSKLRQNVSLGLSVK
jgi:hypothetical protein